MALNLMELLGPNGLTYLLQKIKQMKVELQLEISKKSNFSGNYDDLTNKPTIPTELPNPKAITFTGNATGTYDGSTAVTINIPEQANLNPANSTELGGIKADAKLTTDVVPVRIGQDSFLYVEKYPNVYMTQLDKEKLDEFSDASEYALKSEIASVYRYKGTLEDDTYLPLDAEIGDSYNLISSITYGNGSTVAWNGTTWGALGTVIDLTEYVKKSEMGEIGNAEIDAIWNAVFGGDET